MASNTPSKNLDDIWREVRREFWEKTKPHVDIAEGSGRTGMLSDAPDALMRKLENANAPPDEHPNRDKAARAVRDVMKLLQLVGGLAATAASTIFSPAGMCFNAVSFLIDGVAKMKKFHADLASLFTSIKAIMMRFKMLQRIEEVYKEVEADRKQTLPEEMIATTAKLMACFVKICLFAHKQMSRGGFKSAMVDLRVAFTEDDGGVRSELTKLEGLIKEQDSIKGTITLEEVMKSRADIRQVLEKAARQEVELKKISAATSASLEVGVETLQIASETNTMISMTHKEQKDKDRLSNIARRLDLISSKEVTDTPKVVKDQMVKLEELRERRMTDSGRWLQTDSAYKDWRSGEPTHSVLCLQGIKDTGKSFVVSQIVDDCSIENDPEARAIVAYYFFEKRKDRGDINDKAEATDESKPICKALRCMAYMLAKKNAAYAKKLDNLPQSSKDEADLAKLPPKVLLEKLQLDKTHTTSIYLVFDGLDQELEQTRKAEAFIRELCHLDRDRDAPTSAVEEKDPKDSGGQIRVYRPKFLVAIDPDQCTNIRRGAQMSFLKLCDRDSISQRTEDPRNVADLELFIDASLNSQKSLLAPHLKDDPKLFSEFKEKLLQISEGRFSPIKNRIDLVNQRLGDDNIKQMSELRGIMFSDNTDDLASLYRPVIDELETTLSAEDIGQVNNILIWLTYGFMDSLTLAQADAVASMAQDSFTLLKFSQKWENQKVLYHGLFNDIMEQGETRIRVNEGIGDWLRRTETAPAQQMNDKQEAKKGTITMTIKFEQAEPKAVKRFLWDLHEKLTYDKSFFSYGRQIQAKGRIATSNIEAASQLLVQSLDLLIDEGKKSTEVLRGDAFINLPLHVWNAHDQKLFDGEFPRLDIIVTNMSTFLNSEGLSDFVKDQGQDREGSTWRWVGDRDNVIAMDALLSRDRLDSLPPAGRRSLRLLLDKSGGVGGCLYPMTCQMGRAWLLDETWDISEEWDSPLRTAYLWIERYLTTRREWKEWKSVKVSSPEPSENALISDIRADGDEHVAEHQADVTTTLAVEGTSTPPAGQELDAPFSPRPLDRSNTLGLPLTLTRPDTTQEVNEPEADELEYPEPESRIAQAAEWVQDSLDRLGVPNNQGVLLERLGCTYKAFGCLPKAIETLTEALAESSHPSRIHRWLAEAYVDEEKLDKALVEARCALAPEGENVSESIDAADVRAVKKILADIHAKTKDPDKAMDVLTELLTDNDRDWDIHKQRLAVGYEHKRIERLQNVFDQLIVKSKPSKVAKRETSYLTDYLNSFLEEVSHQSWPTSLVWQASLAGRLDKLLESLDEVLTVQQQRAITETKATYSVSMIQYCRGCVHALLDRSNEGFRKGYESWREASKALTADDNYWSFVTLHREASHAASSYHYVQIAARGKSASEHIRKIKAVMDEVPLQFRNVVSTILAQAYVLAGQSKLAQDLMRSRLISALELLDDDDPDNDWEAYHRMTDSLRACGDVANTLAARSLIHPTNLASTDPQSGNPKIEEGVDEPEIMQSEEPEKHAGTADSQSITNRSEANGIIEHLGTAVPPSSKPKPLEGPISMHCDGMCMTDWTYPDNFWECQVCEDIAFCPSCYSKLQNDTLDRWICHKDHAFFYNPPWSRDEYDRIPKDSVCIPVQGEDGEWSRDKGEIIKIDEWKLRIKKDWGIE